jgi:hypothetical protein
VFWIFAWWILFFKSAFPFTYCTSCLDENQLKNLPTRLNKMTLGQQVCSICWGWQKSLHNLTHGIDRCKWFAISLSSPFMVQIPCLWVGLRKQWIRNLECEKYFCCKAKCQVWLLLWTSFKRHNHYVIRNHLFLSFVVFWLTQNNFEILEWVNEQMRSWRDWVNKIDENWIDEIWMTPNNCGKRFWNYVYIPMIKEIN